MVPDGSLEDLRSISSGIPAVALGGIVESLCAAHDGLARGGGRKLCRALPSREAIIRLLEALRQVLFPGYFGTPDLNEESMRFHVGATLAQVVPVLHEQVKRTMCFNCGFDAPGCASCEDRSARITEAFLGRLPAIRQLLATDVQAAFDGDPAASSADEIIFCYPGLLAITDHRLAHEFYTLGVPLLGRIIAEYAHSITGIDIHPGARIGERFFIDHGSGVVIGETSIIGNNVRIYQGVTLGAKSFPKDDKGNPIKGIPRHPIVEDDVIIYSGATVLGRITVGKGSVIGGNVWLTQSVPPRSRVSQAQLQEDRFSAGGGI